jgi:rSAM/selenodomain-associated transferase 2
MDGMRPDCQSTEGGDSAAAPSGVCLVVMLKSPARAKSRLAARIGDRAREAAEHLWACAYEDAAAWRGPRCFAPATERDRAWLEGWRGSDAETAGDGGALWESFLLVQSDGNLGERISFVDAGLRARGFDRLLFIGTDCPSLTPIYLERAARLLDDHDAVLGPARDGGVVLMGAKRPWPSLEKLPWSRADLGHALETLLCSAGWTVAHTETLADIDAVEDLAAAAHSLRGDPRPERRALVGWVEHQRLAASPERPRRGHGGGDCERAGAAGIALIIPVRDDAAPLRALLESIAAWATAPAEVIVVADDLDPALERLCCGNGARLIVAAPNRGGQLDAGARAATAPVLWFVHADASLPSEGLDAIGLALADGADAGCFRFTFRGEAAWYKALLARLVALRVRLGGIPYGDQGLFARRDVYLACGGFPHQPLFEEVRLVTRLRQRGTFRPLREPIGVSPRRWERDGWWRRTLRNRWLALRFMLGASAERLARGYHGSLNARSGREE